MPERCFTSAPKIARRGSRRNPAGISGRASENLTFHGHAILNSMPENPFQDSLRFERRVPECAIVIFGANGDLTKRKLLPALYRLAYDRRLPGGFAILGISRTPLTDDQFREKMLDSVKKYSEDTKFDEDVWKSFAAGLFYI